MSETITIKLDAVDFIKAMQETLGLPARRLKFKRLHPSAKAPKRGSDKAAGYDLSYAGDGPTGVGAGTWKTIPTGLALAIPPGHYGRIAPRSGLANKKGIDVLAGVIDEDYRGEVGVILYNHGSEPFWIDPGDRIAQIVLEAITTPDVEEVENLDETERSSDGFGSTGIH